MDKKHKPMDWQKKKYLDNFIVYQNTVLQTLLKPLFI